MAPNSEAMVRGTIDPWDIVVITNSTGAAVVQNEVINIANNDGDDVAYVVREDIAAAATGRAAIGGLYNLPKAAVAFVVGDDVYWGRSANQAIHKSAAKTGDFRFGRCEQAAASGDSYVNKVRMNEGIQPEPISTSSSISSSLSVSSSSLSVSSTSSVSVTV